jgi:hypothetical protein
MSRNRSCQAEAPLDEKHVLVLARHGPTPLERSAPAGIPLNGFDVAKWPGLGRVAFFSLGPAVVVPNQFSADDEAHNGDPKPARNGLPRA